MVCSGCIQATDIANGTIGPNKLIPGSVNATTIANGVIGPNKLIPGSINTATIATNAITSNKILNGAVKSADIGDGEVTSIDIQNDTITSTDILDSAIKGVDIATGTITATNLGTNSVGTEEVSDDSLTALDLNDEAGAEFISGNQFLSLSGTASVVRQITLTAPRQGLAVVNATGQWFWPAMSPASSEGTCSIRLNLGQPIFVDGTHESVGIGGGALTITVDALALTRVFAVGAGSNTIELICQERSGTVALLDTSMNAIFVPTRY